MLIIHKKIPFLDKLLLSTIMFMLFITTILFGKSVDVNDVDYVIKNINAKIKEINNFHVEFLQELENSNLKEKEIRKGEIYFQKSPLRIRWEIKEPEREIFFITESKIFDFFPEDKVAYMYDLKDILKSKFLIRFISGKWSFDEFVVEMEKSKDKRYPVKLKLLPKNPEPSVVLVYLWCDKNYLIRKIEIFDFFNNKNLIVFKKISINKKFKKSPFEFDTTGIKILKRKN